MDLRQYAPSNEQIELLRQRVGYQPFIFSDEAQAGVADIWVNGSGIKSMRRREVTEDAWQRFTESNARMRSMYNDWIRAICDAVGGVRNLSVVDTGCNAGFFLFRFLQEGAESAVGYDVDAKYGAVFETLNQVTGFQAQFNNTPYDQFTHEIPGCSPADIVVSSAVMCHLSDPTYYLKFLGSITKKCLFLFSKFDDSREMQITYKQPGAYYDLPFPICFDNMTTISTPLLMYGLKEVGFNNVVELPYQESWLPWGWYKSYKAFICLR